MPDVQSLIGLSIGGMRFCRSRGVELESERALPTKQREEKEERVRGEGERRVGRLLATNDGCRRESIEDPMK